MSPVSVRRQSIADPPVGNRWMRVVEYWPSWILLVWLMGAGIALFQIPLGVLGIYFLSRRSQRITSGSLGRMLSNVADELGGRRPVTLLIEASGTRVVTPMTWGMLRPVILLPAEVESWPASRLRLVLLHELAHIKRQDCLTQTVAQIAGALYWFNPLMWQAVRQLRLEAEQACDDIVLQAGCTSQDYARHLLQIARHSCVSRYASLAMVPIGRPSKMEQRLRSILDAGRRRGEVTRRGLCLASITEACVVSLLASVQFYSVPI
jgi:beta-lactamase regulating signal transducer with metallopeptidase domain